MLSVSICEWVECFTCIWTKSLWPDSVKLCCFVCCHLMFGFSRNCYDISNIYNNKHKKQLEEKKLNLCDSIFVFGSFATRFFSRFGQNERKKLAHTHKCTKRRHTMLSMIFVPGEFSWIYFVSFFGYFFFVDFYSVVTQFTVLNLNERDKKEINKKMLLFFFLDGERLSYIVIWYNNWFSFFCLIII